MNNPSPSIRLLLADAHEVALVGTTAVIQSHAHLHLVGATTSGDAALALAREHKPDVTMINTRLQGMSSLDVVRQLAGEGHTILIYAESADRLSVLSFLLAGARGYLLRNAPSNALCEAIQMVAKGGVAFSPEAQMAMYNLIVHSHHALTGAEKRLLELISVGTSDQEIARKLQCSVTAIRRKRRGLTHKLPSLQNSAELAAWGWIVSKS